MISKNRPKIQGIQTGSAEVNGNKHIKIKKWFYLFATLNWDKNCYLTDNLTRRADSIKGGSLVKGVETHKF